MKKKLLLLAGLAFLAAACSGCGLASGKAIKMVKQSHVRKDMRPDRFGDLKYTYYKMTLGKLLDEIMEGQKWECALSPEYPGCLAVTVEGLLKGVEYGISEVDLPLGLYFLVYANEVRPLGLKITTSDGKNESTNDSEEIQHYLTMFMASYELTKEGTKGSADDGFKLSF